MLESFHTRYLSSATNQEAASAVVTCYLCGQSCSAGMSAAELQIEATEVSCGLYGKTLMNAGR